MATIDVGRMVPGSSYRVVHEDENGRATHEGRYVGREVTATGDFLVFEPMLFSADPVLIAVTAVIAVAAAD